GVFGIRAFEHRINISDFGRLGDAIRRPLNKAGSPHFQASAAITRIALEFALDPFAGRSDAMPRRDRIRILCRKRRPCPETYQLFDVGLEALRRDLLQSSGNFWVCWQPAAAIFRLPLCPPGGYARREQNDEQREYSGDMGGEHDCPQRSLASASMHDAQPLDLRRGR